MANMVAVHLLAERDATDSTRLAMFCGMTGQEEWRGEFTTLNGRESRLEYTENELNATCKRCLAILKRTKETN